MPVHYRLLKRTARLGSQNKQIYYAQPVRQGETSLEELSAMISKISAASEGDVLSILRTMTDLICYHLKDGRTVSLGDFGKMRIKIKNKAAEKSDDFGRDNIKSVGVRFMPGKMIRYQLRDTHFLNQEKNKKKSTDGVSSVNSSSDGKSHPEDNRQPEA